MEFVYYEYRIVDLRNFDPNIYFKKYENFEIYDKDKIYDKKNVILFIMIDQLSPHSPYRKETSHFVVEKKKTKGKLKKFLVKISSKFKSKNIYIKVEKTKSSY